MAIDILVPKPWTLRAQLESQRHAGRPQRQLAGSYVDDLTATRNLVLLCRGCRSRFHAKAAHYRQDRMLSYFGRCDDCRVDGPVTAFYHEAHYDQLFRSRSLNKGRRAL